MSMDFEASLERYAELIIRTGLNLQTEQPLLIADPSIRFGVPLEVAPAHPRVGQGCLRRRCPIGRADLGRQSI